jgi:hypothetical protein
MSTHWLLLIHLAATVFMTGVIWFVQIVHYPLFAGTGRDQFCAYELRHCSLTTWVVGPAMLIEAFTAALLLMMRPAGVSAAATIVGIGLLLIIWLSTALLQVPYHERLSQGFDPVVQKKLVRTNWIRTVAWTARSGLALMLVAAALAHNAGVSSGPLGDHLGVVLGNQFKFRIDDRKSNRRQHVVNQIDEGDRYHANPLGPMAISQAEVIRRATDAYPVLVMSDRHFGSTRVVNRKMGGISQPRVDYVPETLWHDCVNQNNPGRIKNSQNVDVTRPPTMTVATG